MLKRNRRKKKSKKRQTLFLLIVIILVSCFLLFRKNKSAREGFYVHKILIEGTEHLTAEEILSCSGIKKDGIIKNTEKNHIIKRLKSNVWIENVLLRECFFGTLVIVIKEREPIAVLKNDIPSLLCSDGKVIPYSDVFSDLPSVYSDVRKDLSSHIAQIKKIKDAFGSRTITIYFRDKERTFVKVNGFKMLIGSNEPLPFKNELYCIFEEMKDKGYTVCDMRFKNQIIFDKGGAL